MGGPDEVMIRIGKAVERGQGGERAAARQMLSGLWEEIAPQGDALHRCALAHYLADLQDDLNEELLWDLRALEAAGSISEDRARQAGVVSPVRGFYPSLHLNLGEAYRRLGDAVLAREQLRLGLAAVDALDDDGYGRMIRGGLDRLAQRLGPGAEGPVSDG
jgi:hypothetical protein